MSWGDSPWDYVKAIVNPAASTVDMYTEFSADIRESTAKGKAQKRKQAEADAESRAKVREWNQQSPQASTSRDSSSSPTTRGGSTSVSTSDTESSSITVGEILAGIGILAAIGGAIYYYNRTR